LIKCKNCGNENNKDAKFCQNCGTNLKGKIKNDKISNDCSECGYTIIGNPKFCSKCGTKIK
jgi:hypothetical protein